MLSVEVFMWSYLTMSAKDKPVRAKIKRRKSSYAAREDTIAAVWWCRYGSGYPTRTYVNWSPLKEHDIFLCSSPSLKASPVSPQGMTREGNNNHGGSRGSLSGMGDGGARRDERMWDGQDRCDDSGRERGLRGAGRDGWANQGQANNNNSGLGVGLNGYSNNSNGRSYYSNRTNDFSSSKGPTNTYSNNGYNDNNNVGYSGYHTAGRGTPNGRSNNGHDPSGFPGHTNAGSGFEQQGQLNVPARLPNCPGLKRKFVPPGRVVNTNSGSGTASNSSRGNFPGSAALGGGKGGARGGGGGDEEEDQLPEELQHLEKAMVDKIVQEIQQKGDPVSKESRVTYVGRTGRAGWCGFGGRGTAMKGVCLVVLADGVKVLCALGA